MAWLTSSPELAPKRREPPKKPQRRRRNKGREFGHFSELLINSNGIDVFNFTLRPQACRERNVCPNSPPRLGGVAAPPRRCSRSLLAQTGWYGMARSHLIDNRVALLIQSVRFANIYKVASHHGSTTPPFAEKRANGTPPNLGGEFLAHLAKCPNSSVRS